MTAAHLYTRRISGIDYRVWTVMLLTCLLCVAFYAYQQIQLSAAGDQPCSSTGITINSEEGKAIELNRTYIFTLPTEANAKVEWVFDGIKGSDNNNVVQYGFAEEGIKKVVAKVNGRCKYEKEVTVRHPVLLPPEKPSFEIIPDSTNPKVGSTVKFSCVTNQQVNDYKWTCIGSTEEVQYGDVAEFTFAKAGTYTVHLIVNNNSSPITSTEVRVAALPLQEPVFDNPNPGNFTPITGPLLGPGENKAPNNNQQQNPNQNNNQGETQPDKPKAETPKNEPTKIDDESFKDLLQEVLNEEKEVEELYQYLFYKEGTIVQEDDKRINLKEFCKKKKKKKIKSLKFKKDEHGIQQIIVEMKGWSPFG